MKTGRPKKYSGQLCDKCDRPAYCRGMCTRHYGKWKYSRRHPKKLKLEVQKYKSKRNTLRKCLNCEKEFLSYGIQNRICSSCSLANAGIDIEMARVNNKHY
jgi:hypothetical protein